MNNNIKKTLNRACYLKEKEKMKRKKTLRKTRLTSKIYCTLTVVTSLLISPSLLWHTYTREKSISLFVAPYAYNKSYLI